MNLKNLNKIEKFIFVVILFEVIKKGLGEDVFNDDRDEIVQQMCGKMIELGLLEEM